MYNRWKDENITSEEYKAYLDYVEERERRAHERCMEQQIYQITLEQENSKPNDTTSRRNEIIKPL